MKNSDRLHLAWGYWFQCNGGLLGMVIFSLILTSGSVALALFPLLFGAIIFTNKMLDWRDGEEEASGRMLETLPLSNRDRKIILLVTVTMTWIGLVGGCGLVMNMRRPGLTGVLAWIAVVFWAMYGWIVLRWEKEKQALSTWKTAMIYNALILIVVIGALEISNKALSLSLILAAAVVLALTIGLTRIELMGKEKQDSFDKLEFPGISEPLRGILDLAEIRLHGKNQRRRTRDQGLQYFEQLPEWDGKDRVSALARRVSDNPVWVNGFHRWMLGLSAQWMQFHPDTNNTNSTNRANSVAPLLVSSRQGLGKSTFCRLLMPDALRAYYTESYDLGSPASAEARLAAYGLINLDEFDKLGASKMPLLKNLMQASALNVRKAYRRSASALPRIASFIGTSNREDLLVDRTGSRRFLCVSLEHAIDCTTPVEHEQLYAQLKAELLSGERGWFNKEEEQAVQQHNALFYKHVPEEEVFRLCFRFATEGDNPQEVLALSATQLFERMKSAHPSAMRGMTAYSLSRILPQLGERVHTAKGNVYRVVEC